MADIQYWNDTLSDEIETVQDLLNSVAQSSPHNDPLERSHRLEQADKKLRGAQGTKRSFKMECRLVTDPNERRRYEGQLARHEKTLASLQAELAASKAEGRRGELFVGADTTAVGSGTGAATGDGEAEGDALLTDASKLQDKTQSSIDAIARMTNEAKDVGMETMEELKRQRMQITSIDEDAMKIEDDLKRADKLIRTFGRRMASDKLIQMFACLNVLLLVGVIVFSILKKGVGDDEDEGGPLSPVRTLYLRANHTDSST